MNHRSSDTDLTAHELLVIRDRYELETETGDLPEDLESISSDRQDELEQRALRKLRHLGPQAWTRLGRADAQTRSA